VNCPLKSLWRGAHRPLLLCLVLLLSACSDAYLPSYWFCKGQSSQQRLATDGAVLESYRGQDDLLLEIFRGKVEQYISAAFTGIHNQCEDSSSLISFQEGQCNQVKGSSNKLRYGELDKLTGSLTLSEQRPFEKGSIKSSGIYSCRYLGHRYPSSIFFGDGK